MRMADPIPTFTYLVTKALERHPDLAYLSVVEPGVGGGADIEALSGEVRFVVTDSQAICMHGQALT